MVTRGEGWGKRDNWGVWDWHVHTAISGMDGQKGKLSTGNYTQYFVITSKGKESEKEYIWKKSLNSPLKIDAFYGI